MGAHHVLFKDRPHAGVLLGEKLPSLEGKSVVVLGLARGGVVPASVIAKRIGALCDVLVIKKLSSPYNPEFAIGAVAPDSVSVVHWKEAHSVGVDEEYIRQAISRQSSVIRQKILEYRKGKKPIQVGGKTVILVDDGAATGATMEAAILWARKKKAREIIVAVPIISKEAAAHLMSEVNTLVTYRIADELESIGQFYESFLQVSDEEVIKLLH